MTLPADSPWEYRVDVKLLLKQIIVEFDYIFLQLALKKLLNKE
jgi:hypothetical protein